MYNHCSLHFGHRRFQFIIIFIREVDNGLLRWKSSTSQKVAEREADWGTTDEINETLWVSGLLKSTKMELLN